jgi:phosphate transport system substrate-binding protein
MVTINQNLKRGFESLFPGSSAVAIANGTDRGIQALTTNSADIAAISRPLTSAEQSQGLVAVAVARDQIAIVVGKDNPYRRSLTSAQVMQIFQGQITDWSQVGGSPGAIAIINRPAISGTHQTFKELVLQGGNFGTTANMTTMAQDATTPLLRQLETDGIGYATYAQVANQQTVDPGSGYLSLSKAALLRLQKPSQSASAVFSRLRHFPPRTTGDAGRKLI